MVESSAMNKVVEVIYIAPERHTGNLPVVYLLHGYGNSGKDWLAFKPDLRELADSYKIMFVCPDGKNSWYWDSPKDPSSKYETFVSKELIEYTDSHYKTIKDRTARAITGYSMGGHGAMWLAFRHQESFGAVGSSSGGLDIRPFPFNWEMDKLLGSESENQDVWEKHTVINMVDRLRNGDLAIIFDCGYDDFFFEINNDFHNKLLKYKIQHDFIVRPGGHSKDYWNNSFDYQILYFKKYFDRNNKSK